MRTGAQLAAACFPDEPLGYQPLGTGLDVTMPGGVGAVSHAELSAREVSVGGREVFLAQLGWVCTAPEFRGRGYATALVQAALQLAGWGLHDYLGLFCGIPDFYARHGLLRAPNLGEGGMVAVLGDAPWDFSAAVDLRGPAW